MRAPGRLPEPPDLDDAEETCRRCGETFTSRERDGRPTVCEACDDAEQAERGEPDWSMEVGR